MKQSVLLIHPDSAVRRAVRMQLDSDSLQLRESDEASFSDLGSPDLVLVAWRLLTPSTDALRWIRLNGSGRPVRVVVLANQDDYADAVRSLRHGADDCVLVPFQGDDLSVRIHAVLNRPVTAPVDEQLSAGPIVLDRRVHRVSVNDQNVDLAPTEFRLLAFLLENQGRVFSRSELLTRAWSSNVKAGHRTVDVHIRRLRQQLEPFRCEEMIQTVRGFGYRLRAEDGRKRGAGS